MVQTPIKTTALTIDKEQATHQLNLLGYKPGDNVYLTAFFPKGDPRTKGENRDKGRKSDRLNYAEVEAWQAEGRGVYLVVNGWGHGKEDVKDCRAIFYEHDDLDKDAQLILWQALRLPEPTVQVDTEGKSIHSYWVLDQPIHPELWAFDEGKDSWKGLQVDLLTFANADKSLKNPNRVMRLAGCWYMENDDSGTHPVAQSRIVGGCGKRYSYNELRQAIPRSKPPQVKQERRSQAKPSQRNNSQDTGEGLLDFRAVGHLLPEWNERGRSGWATFQCPVHTSNGKHSTDHIHVNLSNGAWEAHCGCDRKLIYRAICEMVGHKPSERSFGGTGIGGRRNNGDSGGNGGEDSGNNTLQPNHWNAPVSWNGEIGWLVPTEKEVKEINPNTGEETPVIDDKGKPVTETVMVFFPKCDFDFQIEQELSSVDGEDGGGIVLQVKRSIDSEDSEQKRVIIKSIDYGSAKDFETALKKALGDGIVVNLKSDQLKSLIHVRLREYRERGGRKYRLADRIGQQEDGTWVFADKQFTKDGKPTTQEESGWVYNPQVSPTDAFASPEILDEDTSALRNLIEAQKKVAGSNFMRFLLCDGYVAACLNEQTIVKQEGFMPILNPYGDPGGGKTVGIGSALSLVWGTSDKSGMCSASESYLYERLRRYGSIPSLWDDPPSKRREDKEKLDELIKRNYGKFARKVRGSDQHPHSSFIPTTNHATGDTLPATKSRGINLFFPVTGDLKFEYQPELEDAKRRATGAFRQIISIGYNRTLVREMRVRLQKYLPTAHDRAAIHLAILTWYTQKVVDLAGMEIDVEDWVIKNLCSELNEAQTGLNSIADFVERFIAAKSTSAIGTWNFGLVKTGEQGNCLAIHMPSVWPVIESGDPPPYNRSVLERVLVEKGAIKNKPAKLDRDRDSTLAYQREIHKGRNEGEGWIPPSKPKPVNKKCLLIPERLWGDLGFLLLVPDSPPDDDEGGVQGLVTSGNLEVTSSNLDEVTDYNLDKSTVLVHSSLSGNLVTKKYIEEKNLVESEQRDNFSDDVRLLEESEHLQNLVTGLPELIDEPQSTENTEVELVTNESYQQVTEGVKEVTSNVIAPPFFTPTPVDAELPIYQRADGGFNVVRPVTQATEVEAIQVQLGDRVAFAGDSSRLGTVQEIDPKFCRPYKIIFDEAIEIGASGCYCEHWLAGEEILALPDQV